MLKRLGYKEKGYNWSDFWWVTYQQKLIRIVAIKCKITNSDQLINEVSASTRIHLWDKHIVSEIYL